MWEKETGKVSSKIVGWILRLYNSKHVFRGLSTNKLEAGAYADHLFKEKSRKKRRTLHALVRRLVTIRVIESSDARGSTLFFFF